MAAMVSKEYPGCFPDIEILRLHAQEVNQMLADTVMLADMGYRGETDVVNLRVISRANEVETRNRLIVERFFGRLKSVFMVFSRRWELTGMCFSSFFDVACALTNLTILASPLNQDDWVFNNNLIERWERELRDRIRNGQQRRERIRTRRTEEREEMVMSMLNDL